MVVTHEKTYQALHAYIHNFNVRTLEHGSLGMRLQGIYFLEDNSLQKLAGGPM